MTRPKTRQATLYRLLPDVRGTQDEMFDAYEKYISADVLAEMDADVQPIEVAGSPAVWIGIQAETDEATWCADAATTTGLDLSYTDCRSSGVLLIGVDGTGYAMSYGSGYRKIPDELKDPRFGREFLVRRLDCERVCDMVRRRPNARGRTDSTIVAAGAPAWMLGIAENVEIIRRIGGKMKDIEVTFSSADGRTVKAEGSVGLKMPFGVAPERLVTDIREVARVCREADPDPALAFVEHVQPVTDTTTASMLYGKLDELLAGGPEAEENLVPVVPTAVLDRYGEAHSYTVKIGGARKTVVPSLRLEDFLQRTRKYRPGQREQALRNGHIFLNADGDGNDVLDSARAHHWIEATVSDGSRRYFLMDGDWFEIGADYVRTSRDAISRLFPASPAITLPAWSLTKGHSEYEYNCFVAASSGGRFLCLDRNQKVRDPLGARSSLEICDLLGPDNELIHVKRAVASAPLSHLFHQGLTSAQSLVAGPSMIREQFVSTVAAIRHSRKLPADFRPKKVVYAILMENGRQLSADTLFPFSQATLAHAARILGTYGIEVEVIGIPAA